MSALPFIDTSIFVRHLAGDHPDHSPRATAYVLQLQAGEFSVRTANTVVFETVFVSERFYRRTREQIRAALLPLLTLSNMVLPERDQIIATLNLYVAHPPLWFADCYHVALMKHLDLSEIVTYDQGFDRLPELIRIES